MTLARSLLYQALYGIWAVLMSFAFLPSLILPFWASRFIAWFWTASVFALLKATTGLTHRIEGAENIPDGPVIFASKHQSTWETMIYPYILRDPVTILKRELFWIPFYGWYVKKYGCIGIDRADGATALRGMVRDARETVAAGRPLVVFPEGTRAPPGETRPFQIGIAALYRDLDVPVVPVALNSGHYWPRRSLIRRSGTITIRFLPAIPPGLDRKLFMKRLEDDLAKAQGELEERARQELSGHTG
tara:strand:- start:1022 stop:1759 length:738 start_codon:yes stop_codon:yes gene_type:complete